MHSLIVLPLPNLQANNISTLDNVQLHQMTPLTCFSSSKPQDHGEANIRLTRKRFFRMVTKETKQLSSPYGEALAIT
jgi:hypothetical protein